MTQRLTSSRFPYLPFRLNVRGQSYEMEALLDTGFDGIVAVPTHVLAGGESPDWYQHWLLADGSEVVAPAYRGIVQIGDFEAVLALVTAIGDEPLIGRSLISRFAVLLDHGQRVIVEP